MKKKAHEFNIRLRFNKPISKLAALYHAKQEIHGEYDIDNYSTNTEADEMKIKSIRPKGKSADSAPDLLDALEPLVEYALNQREKLFNGENLQIIDIDFIDSARMAIKKAKRIK